ncbi:MAG: response regulator [bacterium]
MSSLTPKGRILVVDDERSVRITLRLILERKFRVRLAHSCEIALRILEEQASAISLVLLDKKFPDKTMQGEQALKIIHERWPNLLVIMLTVDYQVPSAVQCAKLGAFQYVNKMPNLRDAVLPVVAEAMNIVRLQHETDDYERELRQRRELEQDMRAGVVPTTALPPAKAEPHRVRDFETVRKEHYVYAYQAHDGNLLYAARSLHVSYDSYRDKLIEWGVHVPRRRRKGARSGRRKPRVARHGRQPRPRAVLGDSQSI